MSLRLKILSGKQVAFGITCGAFVDRVEGSAYVTDEGTKHQAMQRVWDAAEALMVKGRKGTHRKRICLDPNVSPVESVVRLIDAKI